MWPKSPEEKEKQDVPEVKAFLVNLNQSSILETNSNSIISRLIHKYSSLDQ